MSRKLIHIALTETERDQLLACIAYRISEADRKNNSGVAPEQKRRTGKFLVLAEIRQQLTETVPS